jgi:hypothetical protein
MVQEALAAIQTWLPKLQQTFQALQDQDNTNAVFTVGPGFGRSGVTLVAGTAGANLQQSSSINIYGTSPNNIAIAFGARFELGSWYALDTTACIINFDLGTLSFRCATALTKNSIFVPTAQVVIADTLLGSNVDMDISQKILFVSRVSFLPIQIASSDPNSLDDYEEGTWTPSDASGASLAFTTPINSGNNQYVKIGQLVFLAGSLTYPVTVDGSNALIGGLPFTLNSSYAFFAFESDETTLLGLQGNPTTTTIRPTTSGIASVTNVTLSGNSIYFSGCYRASA